MIFGKSIRSGLVIAGGLLLQGQTTEAAMNTDPVALCATADQARRVHEFYAQPAVPPPFLAAMQLGLTEVVIASALGPDRAVGVSASEFLRVWESLRQWDDALTLVLKGGQVFEIHGKVHGGQASKISRNYNLDDDGPGTSGHIRPDLMSVIYAVDLPGKEGPVKGIIFYDLKGDSSFSIFVPPALAKPGSKLVAQFEATRDLIRGMPRACPDPQ